MALWERACNLETLLEDLSPTINIWGMQSDKYFAFSYMIPCKALIIILTFPLLWFPVDLQFDLDCGVCNGDNRIQVVTSPHPSPRYWQSAVLSNRSADERVDITINLKHVCIFFCLVSIVNVWPASLGQLSCNSCPLLIRLSLSWSTVSCPSSCAFVPEVNDVLLSFRNFTFIKCQWAPHSHLSPRCGLSKDQGTKAYNTIR